MPWSTPWGPFWIRGGRPPSRRTCFALPEWFGIEAAIAEYVPEVPAMAYRAGWVSDRPVGFPALKRHNAYTTEIYCMGIRPEVHHAGLGSARVAACEAHSVKGGAEFLTVKTLDASRQPMPRHGRSTSLGGFVRSRRSPRCGTRRIPVSSWPRL